MVRLSLARTLALSAALLTLSAPAQAADKITEAAVQSFYMTAASSYRQPLAQYKTIMSDMMADDFKSTTLIQMTIPSQRPFKRQEVSTKPKLMNMAEITHSAMRNATLNYKVKTITIAPDGKSAHITDTSVITGMTPVPGQPITMSGTTDCNDKLVLTKGKLQLSTSVCNARMVMMPRL